MTISTLARWVWFVSVARITITYLAFQSNPRVGTFISQGLAIASVAPVFVIWLYSKRHPLPRAPLFRWLWAYVVFTGASLAWTAAPFAAAAGYWLTFASGVLAAYLLLQIERPEHVARSSLDGYFWGCVFVAAVAWTAGLTYEGRLGNQEYLHPNGYAVFLGFAVLYGVYLWLNEPTRTIKWATCFLIVTLLRSFSKATIVSVVLASAYYLLYSQLKLRSQIKLVLAALLLGVLFAPYAMGYWSDYSEGTTNVETLTGRTLIWATSVEIAAEHPLLGHGIYSYRSVVPPFGDFESWHAHNEWLQQFFAYGTVGLVLALAIYLRFYWHLRSSSLTPHRTFAGVCLLYALLHGLTDANYIELTLPVSLLLLLGAWTMAYEENPAYLPPRTTSPRWRQLLNVKNIAVGGMISIVVAALWFFYDLISG